MNSQITDYLLKLFGNQPVEPMATAANAALAVRSLPSSPEPTPAPMPPTVMAPPASVAAPAPTMPAPAAPAPVQPQTPPVSNTPLKSKPAMPSGLPQVPPPSARYDENARQALYDQLAQKRGQNAGWGAIANVADLNSRVGGGHPTTAYNDMQDRQNTAEKGALGQFEAGRKASNEEREFASKERDVAISQQDKRQALKDMLEMKREVAKSAKEGHDLTLGTRNDQFNAREWDKIVKDADPLNTNSRSSLGLAARANLQADTALKTLAHPMVTNQEAGNVMADMASIYQRGSATQYGMSHQAYNTLYGKIQNVLQEISGNPRDALPDAVKQRLISVLGDLKAVNGGVISQQLDLIERSKGKIINGGGYQEDWKNLRSTLEGAKQPTPPAGGAGPAPIATGWKVVR